MITIPSSLLLVASSPHVARGALWETHQRHFGKDDDPILVWKASTRDMHSLVPQDFIDAALAADPVRAAADYLAQFRSSSTGYVNREALQSNVSVGIYERPPQSDLSYYGFVDPSGGNGSDSMTLAIAHFDYQNQRVVIDALREAIPSFSPEIIVSEFCGVLGTYNIGMVTGDRYAGGWPAEFFSRYGVVYEQAPKNKSECYVDCLALINSRRLELLDHYKAFQQILSLERSAATGGREHIDHPRGPHHHDDLANVIALAGSVLVTHGSYDMSMQWVSGPDSTDQQQPQRSLYAKQLGAYAATMMRLASLNGRRW